MRLYPLGGDVAAVTSGGVQYKAAEDGGFDFPPDLTGHMHATAVGGVKQWETAIEKQHRLAAEELQRMRDPATLYEAVAKIVAAAQGAPAPPAKLPAKAAAK